MTRIFKKALPIIVIVCLLLSTVAIQASAAGSSVAFSKNKLTVGETLTVTARFSTATGNPMYGLECYVDYDPKVLQFTAGNNANLITDGRVKVVLQSAGRISLSEQLTFKTLKVGSSAIKVNQIFYVNKDEVEQKLSDSSATVTVINTSDKASDNANLKSLNVSAGELTPAFSPSVTSYNVTITNDVTELWVQPSLADSKATYVVKGSANMQVGANTRTIVVTAENGNIKSYTVNIIRLDENGQVPGTETPPDVTNSIEVTANGDTLYIDEDFSDVELPAGFEITDYVYNDSTVPAISDGAYIVLYLIDPEEVNTGFYVLGADLDFTPLIKLTVGGQNYYVLPTEDMPEGYKTAEGYQIGEITLPAYVSTDVADSEFFLIYAKGPGGKTAFYRYDTIDRTLQRQTNLKLVDDSVDVDNEQDKPANFIDGVKRFFSGLMGLTTDGKIVAISILAIILLLVAAIIILIIKIATAGRKSREKKEKKPKKEKKAKVETEEDLTAVGFEYITTEENSASPVKEEVSAEPEETPASPKEEETPAEIEATTEEVTATENTAEETAVEETTNSEENSDEDKNE